MLQTGNISPSLGDSIGRYRLIAELARGGMGIVYVAASQGPGGFTKLVAIKELKPDLAQDGDFLTMFLDEARMAARLNHPNIVQTNDVDEHDGRHFIAMEYLEGRSLYHAQKRFAASGGLPQRVVLTVLREVLAALDYAHELTGVDGRMLGFVHRDISPQNIFLTFDGHAKVIDFGIAKARDSSLETKTGVLKGRVTYMAPEQFAHNCDRRSDLFSVGVILAETIMGHRLWHGLNDMEVLARLMRGEIPRVEQSGASEQLLEIVNKALQPRPDDRYATAAQMRDALDEYLWSQGGSPKPREISQVLMREFESERRKRRELVEAALGRLQAGEGGRLATLAVPDPRDHETMSRVAPRRSQSVVAPLPPSPEIEIDSDDLRPLETGARVDLVDLHPRWPVRWLVGGALGAAGLVMLLAMLVSRSAPPTAVAPAVVMQQARPAAAPPPPPPAPVRQPAAPETIMLSVSVVPATAQLSIDDQPIPTNPFVGRLPKGEGWHTVRAVAPGYLPRERLVSFSDNVMIDLTLPPRPAVAPPPAPVRREVRRNDRRSEPQVRRNDAPPSTRPAAVEPAPPPPPAPVAASARATDIVLRNPNDPPKRRIIDTRNPYGDEQ